MKFNSLSITFTALSLFAVSVALPQISKADNLNEVVCAAVHPCKDGEVLAPFNQGPCADKYRLECLSEKVNKVSEDLASCQEQSDTLRTKMRKLIKARRLAEKK